MKDVYVPGEFKRPHINMNTVSMEQHGDDYIMPDADLETRPQIISKEHLKFKYQECFDGIWEFKDFEYHIEIVPKLQPRVQTPHKVALSIESSLKEELDQMDNKA